MTGPAAPDFIRYLAAKQGLDDRSLNRPVWDALTRAVPDRPDRAPLRVLEVGCGIGTMLERLLDWGLLTKAAYTGLDLEAGLLREARQRLQHFAARRHGPLRLEADGTMVLKNPGQDVRITFKTADLLDFMAEPQQKSAWDLLVAHAVLDLIDLATALPPLLALLVPGGLFYFTLNFDGVTILEPPIDPDLDRRIEALYHQTMDRRRCRGRPAGSSLTGRQLFGHLHAAGARVVAAGSSDWVVFPGPEGYAGDEAYFLHAIIDTIDRALRGNAGVEPHRVQAWIAERHRQIEARQLIYLAHQVDVMGYI
jgi:SAM-dependent methyltransferase